MQEYDAPFLSFYSDVHECFIAIGELAVEVAHVSGLIVAPLACAFTVVCWIHSRIKRSKDADLRAIDMKVMGAGRGELDDYRSSWWQERNGLKVESQIVFWTLNLCVVLWLVAALIWNFFWGSVWNSAEDTVGAVLLCALHLYVTAIIGFGTAIVTSLLWHLAVAR